MGFLARWEAQVLEAGEARQPARQYPRLPRRVRPGASEQGGPVSKQMGLGPWSCSAPGVEVVSELLVDRRAAQEPLLRDELLALVVRSCHRRNGKGGNTSTRALALQQRAHYFRLS